MISDSSSEALGTISAASASIVLLAIGAVFAFIVIASETIPSSIDGTFVSANGSDGFIFSPFSASAFSPILSLRTVSSKG
ncbi:MAG: hypothetical protein BWX44_01255 [Spirochaetes bacterium ADurb.Bin001]|nr:MAG: hypothetical protein BWX44_01255 [Spirochaetes bacterium ADurb.Bin001]